ncbi:hypothetical protein FB451DRAFT_1519976, partial [Mycena latifolia]
MACYKENEMMRASRSFVCLMIVEARRPHFGFFLHAPAHRGRMIEPNLKLRARAHRERMRLVEAVQRTEKEAHPNEMKSWYVGKDEAVVGKSNQSRSDTSPVNRRDNQSGFTHGEDTRRPQPNQENRDRGPYGRVGVPVGTSDIPHGHTFSPSAHRHWASPIALSLSVHCVPAPKNGASPLRSRVFPMCATHPILQPKIGTLTEDNIALKAPGKNSRMSEHIPEIESRFLEESVELEITEWYLVPATLKVFEDFRQSKAISKQLYQMRWGREPKAGRQSV